MVKTPNLVNLLFLFTVLSIIHCYGWKSQTQSSRGPVPTSVASSSCYRMNPFIKQLYERDVKLHETPQINSARCVNEWKIHGSCCEVSSLLTYVQKDSNFINQAKSQLVKKFGDLYTTTKQIYAHFQSNTELWRDNLNTMAVSAQSLFKIFESTTFTNLAISMGNKSFLDAFTQENDKCWQHLIKVRSNSLCETCSGRSHSFFKDGKVAVSMHMCQKVIEVCGASFEWVLDLTQFLGQFSDQMASRDTFFKEKQPQFKRLSELRKLILSEKIVKVTDLSDKIRHPQQSTTEKSRAQVLADSSKTCQQLLRISSSPFIEDLADNLDFDMKFFVDAMQSANKISKSAPKRILSNLPVSAKPKLSQLPTKGNQPPGKGNKQDNWGNTYQRQSNEQEDPGAEIQVIDNPFGGDCLVAFSSVDAVATQTSISSRGDVTSTILELNMDGIFP